MQRKIHPCKLLVILILSLFTVSCTQATKIQLVKECFKNPEALSKIYTWWHWVDGNITKDDITRDLEAMHSQWIVQATILNVSLLYDKDYGISKVRFGSDKWYDMFQWALPEAKRLQITIGVHNCDGLSSSGGPWITPEKSMKQFVWSKKIVTGGKPITTSLAKPFALLDFYKDVAVVAFKTNETTNSFQQVRPKMIINGIINANVLASCCPANSVKVRKGDFISITYESPIQFNKIAIQPHRTFIWGNADDMVTTFTLMTSADGKKFSKNN